MTIATTPVRKLKSIGGHETRLREKMKFANAHVTAEPIPAMKPIISNEYFLISVEKYGEWNSSFFGK